MSKLWVCDFCGKHEKEVELMIYDSKSDASICTECIARCNEIVAEKRQAKSKEGDK